MFELMCDRCSAIDVAGKNNSIVYSNQRLKMHEMYEMFVNRLVRFAILMKTNVACYAIDFT